MHNKDEVVAMSNAIFGAAMADPRRGSAKRNITDMSIREAICMPPSSKEEMASLDLEMPKDWAKYTLPAIQNTVPGMYLAIHAFAYMAPNTVIEGIGDPPRWWRITRHVFTHQYLKSRDTNIEDVRREALNLISCRLE